MKKVCTLGLKRWPCLGSPFLARPEQRHPRHVPGAFLIDFRCRIEELGCLKLVNPNVFLLLVSEMTFM